MEKHTPCYIFLPLFYKRYKYEYISQSYSTRIDRPVRFFELDLWDKTAKLNTLYDT